MRPHVRLLVDAEQEAELGHGDLVGRLASAALCLDDARISEAHAMVSLRGDELMLLSLRRRFRVDGVPRTEVVMVAGLEVELAPGLVVVVEDVVLPATILGVELPGLPPQPLHGVTAIHGGMPPSVAQGYNAEADAHVWSTDDAWRARVATGAARPVRAGDELLIGDLVARFVEIPLGHAGVDATRAGAAAPDPLEIVAHYESVHVHRRGGELLVSLSGLSARLVSELVSLAGPTSWHAVASELWRNDAGDRIALRRKWDVVLSRLRRKLRAAGIRDDLIRADGLGHLELLLYEGDVARDET